MDLWKRKLLAFLHSTIRHTNQPEFKAMRISGHRS